MFEDSLNTGERFLCEMLCHRDHLDIKLIERLYHEMGDEAAFKLCEHNRITPIAADALSLCKDIYIPPHWKEAYDETEGRIKEYMNELDKVASLLKSVGIPVVALKNSGITRGLYRFPGASPMGDIDVLVKKSDFRRAHEVLEEHQFVMKFRSPLERENLDRAEREGGAEYSVRLRSGRHLWFELQWRPVAGRWIQPDQEPSSDMLIERSKPIDGSDARLLSPEDNLLQVALHTAKHTYVRAPGFRLHTDVDRIVRSCHLDWAIFVNMVCELRVRTAVYFSLVLARDLLHTPIPAEVFGQISPSRWKKKTISGWLRRVGLFDPDGKKWGRLGYVVFVSLLYDDLTGLCRSVVPRWSDMKRNYNTGNPLVLVCFYFYRAAKLLLSRTLVK